MFTSLSPEIQAAKIMKELGLTSVIMSALTGIERTRLSYAVRAVKELSNQEALLLKQTALRLDEIARSIAPFSLNVESVPNLQMLLKRFEGLSEDVIMARVRVVFEGDGYDQV